MNRFYDVASRVLLKHEAVLGQIAGDQVNPRAETRGVLPRDMDRGAGYVRAPDFRAGLQLQRDGDCAGPTSDVENMALWSAGQ